MLTEKQILRGERWIYDLLHLIVLGLSIFLILSISIDTFKNIQFSKSPEFLRDETWICIVFLADFFIEFLMAHHKKRYFWSRFVFLLVSIPYLALFDIIGWHYSAKVAYFMRFIPLVRGGYALAIVVGWFASNRATSLFFSYIITLIASIYFASLVFYVVEKGVNTGVKDYTDALWWAAMDATTVGSNIVAVTPVGRVLSVVLAALGMMMFPIFTVYVTNLITNRDSETGVFSILRTPKYVRVDNQSATTSSSDATVQTQTATPQPSSTDTSATDTSQNTNQ